MKDGDGWLILILGFLGLFLLTRSQQPQTGVSARAVALPVIENEETWEWTDYKGNRRSLTIHREVKQRG